MSIRAHLALLAGMAAMATLTQGPEIEPEKNPELYPNRGKEREAALRAGAMRIDTLSKGMRDASFSVEEFNRGLRALGMPYGDGKLDPKPTRRYRHNKRG